jgi:hypothetical protein
MLDDLIKDSRAIDLIETLDFQTECGKRTEAAAKTNSRQLPKQFIF